MPFDANNEPRGAEDSGQAYRGLPPGAEAAPSGHEAVQSARTTARSRHRRKPPKVLLAASLFLTLALGGMLVQLYSHGKLFTAATSPQGAARPAETLASDSPPQQDEDGRRTRTADREPAANTPSALSDGQPTLLKRAGSNARPGSEVVSFAGKSDAAQKMESLGSGGRPKPPAEQSAANRPESAGAPIATDTTKRAAFTQALADARKAMMQRDLAATQKRLQVASQNAQTPEDRAQVSRLETMRNYLNQFWNGIRGAIAKLAVAEEIAVGNTRAIVVERGQGSLAVKISGRIYRYQIETLPTPLVMALVERYLPTDVDSRAVVGTFLAVDPKGNRTLARKYWQEAADAGIDTAELLPELGHFSAPVK